MARSSGPGKLASRRHLPLVARVPLRPNDHGQVGSEDRELGGRRTSRQSRPAKYWEHRGI